MQGTLRALACVALVACGGEALAHGGSYTPPPPRNPTNPRGPTPPGRRAGPTTPSGGTLGPVTPGAEVEPPVIDDWTRWWFANRRLLLPELPVAPAPRDGVTSAGSVWRGPARAALRAGLGDRSADVSSAAAVALGKAHDVESSDAFVVALRDPKRDVTVREAAALGLGLLGHDAGEPAARATEALLDVAGDRREDARLRAICEYATALRRDDGAADTFRVASADASERAGNVQFAALSGLGMLGDPTVRGDLEKAMAQRGETHRGARAYAAHGLARLGGAESVGVLRTAAGGRDASTRRAAALALGVVAPDAARPDLEATVVVLAAMLRDDPDASCRGAAAIGLGRIGASGARDALVAALDAKDEMVRPYAALGIGLLAVKAGDPEIVRPLVARLAQGDDDSLRGAAACALGLARAEYAAPALLALVQRRGDARLRAHAAFALGRLGGGVEERQALRELLIERDHDWIPREAALALGSLGDRSSVRVLQRLLESGATLHVQAAGALALGSIGGDEACAVLVGVMSDAARPAIARAMAAVALGRMLDRERGATLAVVGADLDWHVFTPAVQEILTIL